MRALQIKYFIELRCDTPVCAAQKTVIGFTLDECESKAVKLGWVIDSNCASCLCPACTAKRPVQ